MIIKFNPKILIIVATIGLVAIAVFFIFKYLQVSKELSDLKSNPSQLTTLLESENKKVLDKLGLLIQLPEENPRIITITDKNSIANEPLLSKAEVGDAFIIYTNAKKAYLYRPTQNKIIDVIPISAPAPTSSTTPIPSSKP